MNDSNITSITSLPRILGPSQNSSSSQFRRIDPIPTNRQRIEFLKLRLADVSQFSLEELYQDVLELLPDFGEEAIKNLSHLLEQSPHLTHQQLQLAVGLGDLYVKKLISEDFPAASFGRQLLYYYKKAMYFYAKAIQIAEFTHTPNVNSYHQIASRLFIQLIGDMHGKREREKSFFNELDAAKRENKPENFKAIWKRIDQYRLFCTCVEDYRAIIINQFYCQVTSVLTGIHPTVQIHYKEILERVRKRDQDLIAEYTPTKSYVTEKYKQLLSCLRDQFESIEKTTSIEEIRTFQKAISEEYREFFLKLLQDTFDILGALPKDCNYDFRAMGSLGLEEPCPFSDLEPMILVLELTPEILEYFTLLCHILDLQMQALGETKCPEYDHLVFSCVHRENPSGFHLDSGPHEDQTLINTPVAMAQLQNSSNTDPASVDRLVLQSRSFVTNNATISTTYQEELNHVLECIIDDPIGISRRHLRALGFIKARLQDFQKLKEAGEYQKSIVHVKNLYVLPLNYLLGDIALYLGFRHENTLDTIEQIASQESPKMFTPGSISLLKNAVIALYKIRCRLHLWYGRQGEQARIPSMSSSFQESTIPPLLQTEISELERIRVLILYPLYTLLGEVFRESTISKTTQESFKNKFVNIDFIQSTDNHQILNKDSTTSLKLKREQNGIYHSKWFLADPFDYKARLLNQNKERAKQISLKVYSESTNSPVDHSIKKILSLIEKAKPTIDLIKDRNVVSIIGNTKCGKSTTVNYLIGCEMFELSQDKENLESCVEARNPVAKIGHGLDSQTEIPEAFLLPSEEYVLCDMPGYLETRGNEVAISHAANIRYIFTQAKTNRIFILLNYHSVWDIPSFIKLKKILGIFFNSFENLNQNNASLLIGVTHIPPGTDFDQVKNKIIRLAAHGRAGENWNLSSHLEQIIPINPLDASQREHILEKLHALSPSQGSKQFYCTALTEDEIRLIEGIAEEISKKIESYWKKEDIEHILVEYRKLNSLASIEHPSIIKVIKALQEKIRSKIRELRSIIRENASIDHPRKRVKTIQTMRQFKDCLPLDECFNVGERWVSLQFSKREEKLRKAERSMQESVNVRIQQELSHLVEQFASDLKKILKSPGGAAQLYRIKFDTQKVLDAFAQQFPEVIQDLLNLFKQVDDEISLRGYKYYFGDLLPLESLKQEKRKETERLILSFHNQAKIKELEKTFDRLLRTLNKKKKDLVQIHHSSLSEDLRNALDLSVLKGYESICPEVEELISTLAELQSLNMNSQCEQKIKTFLKDIQSGALLCNVNERLRRDVRKFKKVELNLLNRCYQELSRLNKENFEQAYQYAQIKFIKQPIQEINHLLKIDDESYCSKMQIAMNTLHCIKDLSACFSADEVNSTLKNVEKLVKEHESKRREEEMSFFDGKVNHRFAGAKVAINVYTSRHFTQIIELKLEAEDVDLCLSKLQGVGREASSFSEFSEIWEKIKKARASEHQRYYYTLDDRLASLEDHLREEMRLFFHVIKIHSRVLSLQSELDLCLSEIESQAKEIIQVDAQKFLNYEFSHEAGFSVGNLTRLKKIRSALIEESKGLDHEEIQKMICDLQERYKQLESRLINEASKKNVEFRMESLKEICARRAFLFSLPDISRHLSILKSESPESYQEAIKDLIRSINAWIDSTEHEKNLSDGYYDDVVKTLSALKELGRLLEGHHQQIDSSPIERRFVDHLEMLFEEAIQEIDCPVTERKFFKVEKIKKFMNVSRTSKDLEMNVGSEQKKEKLRQHAAQNKWPKVVELIRDFPRLSPLDQDFRLTQLTKEMIKQQAIATELSLEDDFRKLMREHISQSFSYHHIYRFTVLTQAYRHKLMRKHKPDTSAAAQVIINTFPEFERVNIEAYNKKANGITFKMALESLECRPSIDSDARNKLSNDYAIYSEHYTTLLSHVIQMKKEFDYMKLTSGIHRLSTELAPHADCLYKKGDQAAQLLAEICTLWTYLNAKHSHHFSDDRVSYLQPHSTQVLTILRALSLDNSTGLQNHLLEVKTGEGKSICLGIIAALFALLGYKVNVICYSSYLSERDYQAFSELFKTLGVDAQIHYSTVDQLMNDLMGDQLPNYRYLVKEFLKGNAPSVPFKGPQPDKNILLIDEVDVFFGKSFYGQLFRPSIQIPAPELIRYIWKNRRGFCSLLKEKALSDIMRSSEVQNILNDYPKLLPLLKQEIEKMLTTLEKYPFLENHHLETFPGYDNDGTIIQDDRIVYIDRAGNLNVDWLKGGYKTTFDYLYWQEKGKIRSDRYLKQNLCLFITCGGVLYSELPHFFKYKIGLTATLNRLSPEENKVLKNIYQFNKRSFIPSTFQKQSLVEAETLVIRGDKKDYFAAILEEIQGTIKEKRACFIVLKEIKDVTALKEYLVHLDSDMTPPQFTSPEVLTEMIEDREKVAVISRAPSQCKVTLMTRVFGRGIDFVCRDEMLCQMGGVHIILGFYPETPIEENQIKGRTCRQDDPGSIRKILFSEDLIKQGFLPSKREEEDNSLDGDQTYDSNTNIANCLALERGKLNSKRSRRMNITLEINRFWHEGSLELVKNIEEGRIELVHQFLKKLNESVY